VKKRLPLAVRQQRWAQLANIGRLMLNELDVHQILEAAANEIWLSMRKWGGRPDDRFTHALNCTCGDCT
jgi:hypothetical protein